jgi:hypothetical protein
MPAIRGVRRLGTVVLAVAVLAGSSAVAAGAGVRAEAGIAAPAHHGIIPPKHPSRSLAPSPSFLRSASCTHGKDGAKCNGIVRKAITHARRVLEKFGGMTFSQAAYEKLTPVERLFVTANLERTERGLPPVVVLSKTLDKVAQAGANADDDPPLSKVPARLPGGGRWVSLGGNWAGGWDNPLGADYAWMYDDGGQQHWGHRGNILGKYVTKASCGGKRHEIAMGAGHVTKGKRFGDSETELFAGICGPTPTDVVLTWSKAKRLLHIK